MAAYKVEICGVNTAKLPILKESEKEELFAKIKQGDMAARETYIKIFHICRAHDHRGDPKIPARQQLDPCKPLFA